MFGFVTFASADTVRMILSRGNPHFVCGARVLVKPYREKSKLFDRYMLIFSFSFSCGEELPFPGLLFLGFDDSAGFVFPQVDSTCLTLTKAAS